MFKNLLLQIILILINAFFAATEIAIISLNEKKMFALSEDGDKKAAELLKIIEAPTSFLSTIQIGITLAGFLASAFAADNFAEKLSAALIGAFNISEKYSSAVNTVSVVLITLILSYFTLIFGELVPKRLAMKYKEKLARYFCGTISFLTSVLKPVTWFLTVSTNAVLRIFGIDPNEKDDPVSEEDIVLMLDAGADEGSLDEDDIEYIKNVFKLDKMCAQDVMTPANSLVSVTSDASVGEILEITEREGYSRIPVFDSEDEHVIGILHTRDFLLKYNSDDFSIEKIMHQPVYVPESVSLDCLFKDMQTNHNHIVVVIDEYGETAGIVTMEDILEEIVGEIWDEHDEAVEEFIKTDTDTYQITTSASIDDFREFFSIEDDETEASTVNGWLTEISGTIPPVGYTTVYRNLTITVTAADDFMTHEICVKVNKDSEDAE